MPNKNTPLTFLFTKTVGNGSAINVEFHQNQKRLEEGRQGDQQVCSNGKLISFYVIQPVISIEMGSTIQLREKILEACKCRFETDAPDE